MAENKTTENSASVDAFLDSIADEQQKQEAKAICKLMREATGEEPKKWGDSIIGFGHIHMKYASGRELDWMLTGFSPRKSQMTLYVMTGFGDYAAASGYDPKPLLDKLGKYSTGKSCLYIKKLADVAPVVLKRLVAESAEHLKIAHS